VLRAAGAETAKIIAVCVDRRETADRIVAVVKEEFPAPEDCWSAPSTAATRST
jgi:glutathione-regulated potassium-efflux system protein KefB